MMMTSLCALALISSSQHLVFSKVSRLYELITNEGTLLGDVVDDEDCC
jgi:hypothetical protein